MKIHANLNLSIDGFGSPPYPAPEEPSGEHRFRLVDSCTATLTFRERVLGDTTGRAAGLEHEPVETYRNGVRHVTIIDPDGNSLSLASQPDTPRD